MTPRSFAVKTHSTDDSRYGPCNQSDTRECQPYRAGVLMQFAAVVGDLDEAEAKATAGACHLLTIAPTPFISPQLGATQLFLSLTTAEATALIAGIKPQVVRTM